MTLANAVVLQEKWKARHRDKICKHAQIIDHLIDKNGRKTDYIICLECGKVFLNPTKDLSPTEFATLVQHCAEEEK